MQEKAAPEIQSQNCPSAPSNHSEIAAHTDPSVVPLSFRRSPAAVGVPLCCSRLSAASSRWVPIVIQFAIRVAPVPTTAYHSE
jgi:hypothetical protein